MKILIVEDEKDLLESVHSYLKDQGYTCEIATDFNEAIDKIHIYNYSCILLDINLPDGSGIDLIKPIKDKNPSTGIIMISARNALEDRLETMKIGADDYLIKPFHLSELNVRIQSVLRRINFEGTNEVSINALRIRPDERQVFYNSNEIDLTKKEFNILMFFISNKNKVLTKEAIGEYIWGDFMDSADSFDFVYTHIKNLRKKIAEQTGEDMIKTVYGVGYKFIEL